MKKIAITLILAALAVPLFAAFEDEGWTARSRALGNSLFADFDPLNSMNFNPATIAMARGISTYVDWGTPYLGLNDGSFIHTLHFSIVGPFWNKFTIPVDPFVTKRGAIALSVYRMSVTGDDGFGGSTEVYHEGIYSFFYAKDLNDVLSRGAKISAGMKLSLYDIGVGASSDVNANPAIGGLIGASRLGFGLDLGITYDFSETIRLGAVYRNLITPNVSILPGGNDSLAGEIRLGANWDIGDLFFMKRSKVGGGLVMYQRGGLSDGSNTISDNRQSETSYNVGFEFKQITMGDILKSSPYKGELLTVRLGGIYQARTAPLESIINITGGLGFTYVIAKDHKLQLDYTMEYVLNEGSLKQGVGLTYELMLPNSAFAYKDEVRKELEFEELINKKSETVSTNAKVEVGNQTNAVPERKEEPKKRTISK